MKNIKIGLIFLLIPFFLLGAKPFDLGVVGFAQFVHSIGRVAIGIVDCLKDDLTINFIDTRPNVRTLKDIPEGVAHIIQNSVEPAEHSVSILIDHLWMPNLGDIYKKMPKSDIKIALSVVESTKIPNRWVSILNDHFDMVVVPDKWLIDIYISCGVTIPIFCVPHNLYIDEFLIVSKINRLDKHPFTFGVAASFSDNKNLALLIKSFAREFKNNPEVQLKVHASRVVGNNIKKAQQLKRAYRNTNISLHLSPYSWDEYIKFMHSLDCYVLISKGEGFSITPREAMAAGIPCILSDNTAHKFLCKQPFVLGIPCPYEKLADHGPYGVGNVGMNFDCKIKEVRKALREMYDKYYYYKSQALYGRQWVRRYTHEALRSTYLSLFKPKQIALGDTNIINENGIITTSSDLAEKYQKIIDKNNSGITQE